MTHSNCPFQRVGSIQGQDPLRLIINDLRNHFQGNSMFKKMSLWRAIKVDFFQPNLVIYLYTGLPGRG